MSPATAPTAETRTLPRIVVVGAFTRTAADYHARGLNVLPIVTGEKVPPRGLLWKRWQRTPQTSAEIAALVAQYPEADMAVVCGPVSRVVDIETDGPRGEQALRSLQLPLPPTAMFTAPRGTHRLFLCEQPLRTRRTLRPQLDIHATGAYVVVPPSLKRTWWSLHGFDDLIPLPAEWEALLLRARRPLTGPALLEVERDGVDAGVRNVTMAALVGSWLTRGMPEADILRRARAWARRCVPPLPEMEGDQVVASVLQARRQSRSPEREAMLIGRTTRLDATARLVLVGLTVLYGELGCSADQLTAPVRLVAGIAGVSPAAVSSAYRRLAGAGVITIGMTRDPISGRRTTLVRLCGALAAAVQGRAFTR